MQVATISEHSAESGAIAAYISWAEDVGLEVSSEEFESRYCGHWESGEDFALKSGEIEELYQWSQFEKEHHSPFYRIELTNFL